VAQEEPQRRETDILGGGAVVSVLIPTDAGNRWIVEALRGVSAQTCPHWEVVVVEHGVIGTGAEEVVRAFAAQHPGKRVEHVRHPEPMAPGAAWNEAIGAAHGEVLAFLDPRDVWLPGHLEAVLTVLSDRDTIDVVASSAEVFRDAEGHPTTGCRLHDPLMGKGFPHSLAIMNIAALSGMVARADAVRAVGGFDPDPSMEPVLDHDLCVRLAKAERQFWFHSTPTVRYREDTGRASRNPSEYFQAQLRLYGKHPKFFREGRDRIIGVVGNEVYRLEEQVLGLKRGMRRRFGGPIMRTLLRLDAALLGRFGKAPVVDPPSGSRQLP